MVRAPSVIRYQAATPDARDTSRDRLTGLVRSSPFPSSRSRLLLFGRRSQRLRNLSACNPQALHHVGHADLVFNPLDVRQVIVSAIVIPALFATKRASNRQAIVAEKHIRPHQPVGGIDVSMNMSIELQWYASLYLRPCLNGRGERIRTSDPLVPNQVRYQTALRPELCVMRCRWRMRSVLLRLSGWPAGPLYRLG